MDYKGEGNEDCKKLFPGGIVWGENCEGERIAGCKELCTCEILASGIVRGRGLQTARNCVLVVLWGRIVRGREVTAVRNCVLARFWPAGL